MAKSSFQELVAMGYSEPSATRALEVAGGDMEQAVGYLLMGEQSQAQLSNTLNSSILVGPDEALLAASTRPVSKPGAYAASDTRVEELVQMGYNRRLARQALSVSNGDMDQAVNFLLMGDSRTGFVLELQSSFRLEDDAAMAALLQDDEGHVDVTNQTTLATSRTAIASRSEGPDSAMYHPTTMLANSVVPKMVVTGSFLATPGAGPFCACMAASKFLSGGVVTAEFLNNILEGGVELFRKSNSSEYDVAKVLKKCGKSPLQIEAMVGETEPKKGVYMSDDLQHTLGIRKQLALCRNQQPNGWQLLIIEIPSFEAICIALPPKGTKNKFWYLDFYPRSCFRVSGAYARVHSTLLQLEESLEAIFEGIVKSTQKKFEDFNIFMIKKRP